MVSSEKAQEPAKAPSVPSAIARRLGIPAEPTDEAQWKLSVLTKDRNGKVSRRSGSITARRIRELASAHQMRMESRRLHASKGRTAATRAPSPVRMVKSIEGEEKSKRMPLAGLHPKYGWLVRGSAKVLAFILDAFCLPLRGMKGTQVIKNVLLSMSIVMFTLPWPTWWILTLIYRAVLSTRLEWLHVGCNTVRWTLPLILLFASLSGIAKAVQIRLGRKYMSALRPWHDPSPAWRDEPVFHLGKVVKILSDLYEGTITFGGTGSGKTASVISPLLLQMFRKLNNPDPNAIDARFFALMLDVKGNFADLVTYLMVQVKRPLTDLIFVDPELDLYRYNPIDARNPDFAQNGAATLAAINRIMGNESKGGDNVYWDNTSKNVVEYMLKNLSIIRPKNRIGLDDVGRFTRDNDRVGALLKQATAVLEIKRRNNAISIDEYNEMTEAVSELKNNWQQLDGRTKGILKTTIAIMLGPIPSNPRLQRVFCRDTNFSMRDVINDGKIVIFRAGTLDFQTARMIAVCLKRDFQWWTRRRIGKQGRDLGLNETRTGAFIADEFQEMVTCGGEGDETYFGVCRDSRIISLVGTQGRSSLDVAIKNEAQLKTLLTNLTTKIFLKMSDKDTQEMGSFHAGKYHREKERATIHHGNLFGAMVGSIGQKGGAEYTTSVDEHLEDYFRPDDFGRLVTIPKKKSLKGPWYSEAIIFNYSETDGEKVTWAVKTRLSHLYPEKPQQTTAALYFDDLLYARNAQAKTYRMFYAVAAVGMAARKAQMVNCDAHAKSVEEQLNRRAARRNEARPQSEAEIHDRILAQYHAAEKEANAANEVLVAYERTKGIHGSEYPKLHESAMRALANRNSLRVLIGPIEQRKAVLIGGTTTSRELLQGRSPEECMKKAAERGIPEQIVSGTKADLQKHGPSAGLAPRPGNPNALDLQNSAIAGAPEIAPVSVPVSAPTPEKSAQPADVDAQLNQRLKEALQQPKQVSEHERQLRQHAARFSGSLDTDYDKRFPEPEKAPPPPPGPAAPTAVPASSTPAAKAAVFDQLIKTNEEDYS